MTHTNLTLRKQKASKKLPFPVESDAISGNETAAEESEIDEKPPTSENSSSSPKQRQNRIVKRITKPKTILKKTNPAESDITETDATEASPSKIEHSSNIINGGIDEVQIKPPNELNTESEKGVDVSQFTRNPPDVNDVENSQQGIYEKAKNTSSELRNAEPNQPAPPSPSPQSCSLSGQEGPRPCQGRAGWCR